jgi:hypothetical protein
MKSLAHACATATQQGLVVPALRCKIFYTGTKVSGDKVTFEATFNPDGLLEPPEPGLVQVGFDDVKYTAHVKE